MFPFSVLQLKQYSTSSRSNHVSTRLTREGLQFIFLLLFIVLAAILQSINMLVLMSGTFSAMLLIQWRLCSRTLAEISAIRVLPSTIQARKPFPVQIAMTNPRKLLGSWLLMIRDRLTPDDTPYGHGGLGQCIVLMLGRLLPQSTSTVVYQCSVPTRGCYQFSDPEISTRFPLSLMRCFRSLPAKQSILAHPTQGTIAPNWRELLQLPEQGRLLRQASTAGGDGEFFGLRDYRSGDPMRHVHWRTSAKRGELVIRQFEREENRAIGIVLDLWGVSMKDQSQHVLLEFAIELVASLITRVVCDERSVATLSITTDEGPVVSRIQTVNQLTVSLDRLAVVHSQLNDTLTSTLHQTLRFTGGREPIIVVSTRSKSEFKENVSDTSSNLNADIKNKRNETTVAIEGRLVWLDVAHDRLEQFFVQG